MNVTLRPRMSRDEFFAWAEAQEERYEFDGERPVIMNGSLLIHDRLQFRLMLLLHTRLSGQGFEVLGPTAGVATMGQCVRYPDALVSRGSTAGTERLVSDVVAVFEVLSPSSSRTDRIVKLREYGSVTSIRSYVILETESVACLAFHKQPDGEWIASPLTADDSMVLPELGIELPLAELYAGLAA